jgi:hypothetical protein
LIKKIYSLFIVLSVLVTSLQSQTATDTSAVLDTLIAVSKVSSRNDSTTYNFNLSYYFSNSNFEQNIEQSDIIKADYLSFSDLLKNVQGYFVADYGNPCMYNPIFYQGLPPSNTSILLDGIPFGNNFFGLFEQSLIMMDDIERIEIISSTQSIAYGNINLINVVTTKRKSKRPITYVRHSEAAYETYLTNMFFTSNITQTSNIYVGFNYHISDGRFSNSDYSCFGGRLRYRNIIFDKVELNISDYFSKFDRGLYGGVKLTSDEVTEDIFDERVASVQFPNAKQIYSRNIISAQLSGYFFNDSLQSSLFTISLNTEENTFNDVRIIKDSLINLNVPIKTNMFSITAKQNILFDNQLLSFYFGSSFQNSKNFLLPTNEFDTIYYNNNGGNNKIYFSLVDRIMFSDIFELNLSGMYLIWANNHKSEAFTSSLNFGINPSIKINDFIFSAGFVWGNREPFPIETFSPLASAEDVYKIMSEPKNFNKFFADVVFQSTHYNLKLALFRSWLDKQTLFEFNTTTFPLSTNVFGFLYNTEKIDFLHDIENMGFSINANLRLGKIELESNLNYNHYNNNLIKKIMPELFCHFGLYYESKLISDNINLKIGFNGSYYSQFILLTDISQNESLQETKYYSPNGIINFLAALTIQTATIYISVNNLFNNNYFVTKIYPMNDRNFQLSISWTFFD